jgi:hypothetical protein
MWRRGAQRREEQARQAAEAEAHAREEQARQAAEVKADERFAYEMLMLRSIGTNTAQWQVPGLAIAAQAFLLTITLDPDTARGPRVLAALAGLLITYMTLQLLRRHRYYYKLDSDEMDRLSAPEGLDLVTRETMKGESARRPHSLFGRSSSGTTWTVGLTVLMAFNLALAVLATFAPIFFSP